jgi:hypothetical protein
MIVCGGGVAVLYQGTTSQAAEKLYSGDVLCQGTTSVVPQVAENK